jgi:hypothetical protein
MIAVKVPAVSETRQGRSKKWPWLAAPLKGCQPPNSIEKFQASWHNIELSRSDCPLLRNQGSAVLGRYTQQLYDRVFHSILGSFTLSALY